MLGALYAEVKIFLMNVLFGIFFNPFVPNASFLYPLKTSEGPKVSEGRERVHWKQMD